MGKKIVAIVSTPRTGGNSEILVQRFTEGAAAAGHTCTVYYVRDLSIGFCRACRYCIAHKGECIQSDDMTAIRSSMMEADVIVLSTPVYKACMSAQLKTVADRMYALNRIMTDKDFYFIASAADEREGMESTMVSMQGIIRAYKGSRLKGRIYGSCVSAPGDVRSTPAMDEAYAVGFNC